MNEIVLLGARTSLGMDVLTRLVAASGASRIHVLHEGDALETTQRFFERLEQSPGLDLNRVESRRLDFTEHFAGLPDALLDLLTGEAVDVVFDLSAFDAGLSVEESEHLYGRVVDDIVGLCASNSNARIHVLSSLFVAGNRFGGFTEYDFDLGQRCDCPLDQARLTIEQRLLERIDATRMSIYRLPILLPDDNQASVEPVTRRDALVQAVRMWRGRAWADPRAVLPFARTGHAAEFIARNVLSPDPGDGTAVGVFHIVEQHRGMMELVESIAGDGRKLAWRPRAIRNWLVRVGGDSLADTRRDCARAVRDDFYTLWQADTFRFQRRRVQLGIEAPAGAIDWNLEARPGFDAHACLVRALRQQAALGLDGVYTLDGHDQRVVDDIPLDYWNIGEGPVVVLLPGVLGPESTFGLARRLRRDFQVIVPDSHGAVRRQDWSDPEARLSREAALVKGLLAQLEIRKADRLVAFDLSVPVALYHQSRWPSATDGVMMVNPTSETNPEVSMPAAWKRWNRRSSMGRAISFWVARHSIKLASRMAGFNALFRRSLPDVESRMWRLNRRLAPDRTRFDRTMRALGEAATMDPATLTRARAPRSLIWACDQALGTLSHGVELLTNATNDETVWLIANAGIDVSEHKPRQLATVIRESVRDALFRVRAGDGKVAGLPARSAERRTEHESVPARSVRTA
ncbi:MAG: hypothetical protein WD397_11950 [Wenzhouxiangellaceae bacterium]